MARPYDAFCQARHDFLIATGWELDEEGEWVDPKTGDTLPESEAATTQELRELLKVRRPRLVK